MTHTHNTDQMFRDAVKRYREKPPENAWAVIDSVINKGKTRKAFILFASAAAVVILLLGFGAGYLYRSVSDKTPEIVNLIQNDGPNLAGQDDNLATISNDVIAQVSEIQNDNEVIASENSSKFSSSKTISNKQPELFSIDTQEFSAAIVENDVVEVIQDEIGKNETIPVVVHDNEIQNADTNVEMQDPEMTQQERDIQLEQMLTKAPDNSGSSISETSGETYYYNDMPTKSELYNNKWSVGGDLAAAYSFRNMPSKEMEYKERSPIAYEQGVSSWNAGVYAANEIGAMIRVKTGVTWASYGQGSQNLYAYQEGPSFSVNSSSGNVNTNIYTDMEGDKPLSNNSLISDPDAIMLNDSELFGGKGLSDPNLMLVQRFDYLEIPLMIQFSTKRERGFSFVTEAGLYAGILTGNRAFLNNSDERYLVGYTENLRPLSLGAVAGAGAKYAISKSLSAEIIPEFRYSFFSISKIPEIEYHPYQFGLGLGLTYHF